MNDPKIVKPGDVEFGADTNLRPDSLEVTISQDQQSSIKGPGNYVENMTLLGEKLVQSETLNNLGTSIDNSTNNRVITYSLESVKHILPYGVSLKGSGPYYAQIFLEEAPAEMLRLFLESESQYGPNIAHSGIYEAIGLNGNGPINIVNILNYFPEFKVLRDLNEKYLSIKENHYQTILALPIHVRPFFAGVTFMVEDEKKLKVNNSSNPSNFVKVLTLKDILRYAEKTSEINRVKEYMDAYNSI